MEGLDIQKKILLKRYYNVSQELKNIEDTIEKLNHISDK